MNTETSHQFLQKNIRILKSKASKTAYQSVLFAFLVIILATMLTSFVEFDKITLHNMYEAQKTNYVLWLLNSMPFFFAIWGQYSGDVFTQQAQAMVLEETQALREKADSLEQQANYSATHDELTNLPNKALFYDRANQAILSATLTNQNLSILAIDIFNYKEIHDTLGRNASDSLIKQISVRLSSGFQTNDTQNTLARIDTNTFSLLCSGPETHKQATLIAKQIQEILEPAFIIDKVKLSAQANIGLVHFPDHGEDADTLIQRAGIALYMAQNSNQGIATYDPSFDDHSPRRLTLMSELSQAVNRNELELYYQPKIDLKSGQVEGVEALIRWNHRIHGLVPPDDFIPMVERTRSIQLLTLFVLKQSFLQCAAWRKQGLNLTVAINLSAKDLQNTELPDLITGLMVSTEVDPAWMVLEITESAVMHDPELALSIINRIHDLGFNFTIDDFGTGYSSLAYLKRMPLRGLKIDRSFVIDLLTNSNDALIVSATINLAHNLGYIVTAEGIESSETARALLDQNCDLAQGYYFSKPLPLNAFEAWLKDYKPNNFV